jgi:hypothetical protein
MAQKIGIIGSGQVAVALAKGFLQQGCPVMIGSGDTEKRIQVQQQTGAESGSFAEAAAFGELLVLAVKGSAAVEVLSALPEAALAGKTVIDATNPIADHAPINGVLQYFTPQNGSLGAMLQAACPSAHIVKAFSCVGNAFMVNPQFPGGQPTMFICGNHQAANDQVADYARAFGWDVEDLGKIEAAGAIESLCVLWCLPGFTKNQWSHAFKLLRMP